MSVKIEFLMKNTTTSVSFLTIIISDLISNSSSNLTSRRMQQNFNFKHLLTNSHVRYGFT